MALNIFVVLFALQLSAILGSEEVFFNHVPEYIKLNSDAKPIRASEIPEVLSAAFGYTIKDIQWDGLQSGNPFHRPEASVVFKVDGFRTLNLNLEGQSYPLQNDVEPDWGYQLVADRTYNRFADKKPFLMEIANDETLYATESQYPLLLEDIPSSPKLLFEQLVTSPDSVLKKPTHLKSLNISNVADGDFLAELQLVRDIGKQIKAQKSMVHDGVPDVYWIKLTGIQQLLDSYGADSSQVREALEVLKIVLDEAEKNFVAAYNGNVIVVTVAVDNEAGNEVLRSKRETQPETKKPTKDNPSNVSENYSDDYAAIFNIIVLTSLIIILTVFAIALSMWFMDPGKDSIIYRMTNQRMRKDQ